MTPLEHLRMPFVVLIRLLGPSQVPSLIHRPLAVVPLILRRDRVENNHLTSVEWLLTKVTTMKSLDASFEEASFSAAHKNAARAVGSTSSADSVLPCKKNSTTTGSEVRLSRKLARVYMFVDRPATFNVSFTTSEVDMVWADGGHYL